MLRLKVPTKPIREAGALPPARTWSGLNTPAAKPNVPGEKTVPTKPNAVRLFYPDVDTVPDKVMKHFDAVALKDAQVKGIDKTFARDQQADAVVRAADQLTPDGRSQVDNALVQLFGKQEHLEQERVVRRLRDQGVSEGDARSLVKEQGDQLRVLRAVEDDHTQQDISDALRTLFKGSGMPAPSIRNLEQLGQQYAQQLPLAVKQDVGAVGANEQERVLDAAATPPAALTESPTPTARRLLESFDSGPTGRPGEAGRGSEPPVSAGAGSPYPMRQGSNFVAVSKLPGVADKAWKWFKKGSSTSNVTPDELDTIIDEYRASVM